MIFISYRRADSAYLAAEVCDAIAARLGSNSAVFLDVASIPPGAPFADVIRESIDGADAVLALIGRHWREDLLARADDFVRLELTIARQLGKRIVPVLHSGRPMVNADELPNDLRWLTEHSAFTIAEPPRHLNDLVELADHVARWVRPVARTVTAERHGSLDFMTQNTAVADVLGRFATAFRRREP